MSLRYQICVKLSALFLAVSVFSNLSGQDSIQRSDSTNNHAKEQSQIATQTALDHRPPNVLMICIDDLNDWTGYLGGHPQARTPNLDRLAKTGRAFTNAHCAVPVCSASRISVFSGLHATTHGSYELGPSYTSIKRLDTAPTLHATFKQNGYETLTGGKVLHHGFKGRLEKDIDTILYPRHGGPRPKEAMHWNPRVWDYGPFPETDDQMDDMKLAQAAATFLQQPSEQPFFMTVGFFRPHVPMYVPPRWFEMFDRKTLVLPDASPDDMLDIPDNFKNMNQIAPDHQTVVQSGQWPGFVQAYLASTAFVDHCVGTVLAGLSNGPHMDHTLIVLWSDHGFHLGEKQHWAKRTLWEESTRVPLIFAGKRIRASGSCQEPASLVDLYPTLIEYCELKTQTKLDGISLVPQLNDLSATRAQPVRISSFEGNHAIRSKHWRYIRYRDGSEELYDHRSDAKEHKNLSGNPDLKSIQDRLASYLPTEAAAEVKPIKSREANDENLRQRRKDSGPIGPSP
jgi:arylsulfatase A-like enzyme